MTNDFSTEKDEALIPDGWDEDTDIFSLGEDDEKTLDAGFNADNTDDSEESLTEQTPADDDTTSDADKKMLTFDAKIDHETVHVDLDPDDLPTIYQKSQALDRAQSKLKEREEADKDWEEIAKLFDYESPEAMRKAVRENYRKNEIQKLIDSGVNETVAEVTIDSRIAKKSGTPSPKAEAAEEQKAETNDYSDEIKELWRRFPETAKMPELPAEVTRLKFTKNISIADAYAEFDETRKAAELSKAKKENKILKQNAASAARAPVTGTKGGGAVHGDTRNEFDRNLLKGFDEDYY